MGIDVLLAGLAGVGDLFAAPAAAAGVDALGIAGDVAATDAAAAGVAGIADVASLTPEALAGLTSAVPAAGIADVASLTPEAIAGLTTIPAATSDLAALEAPALDIPAGVETAALGNLGTPNTSAFDALNYAATPAQSAVQSQVAGVPGMGQAASVASPEAASATVQSPGLELTQGNPQLQAALSGTPTDTAPPAEGLSGPTTTQTAMSGQTIPFQDAPFSAQNTASAVTPDVASALNSAPAAAAPTSAAAPAAASPSVSSQIGNVLNSPITKAGELALPLGFLGYNMLKGPAPIPPQAQAAETNAINQLGPLQGQASQNVPLFNQTAATDLNLANNFQISPAQAASIDTYKQNSMNQLYQQLANEGNTDPTKTSQWLQGLNQINQQALTMQVQMVNQLISTAFQSASAANAGVSTSTNVTAQLDSTFMQAAQLQVQNDTAFQQATGQALQAFAMMAALQNYRGTATA